MQATRVVLPLWEICLSRWRLCHVVELLTGGKLCSLFIHRDVSHLHRSRTVLGRQGAKVCTALL